MNPSLLFHSLPPPSYTHLISEIDARLKKVQDDFEAALATCDPQKVAQLYHPAGVMVQIGRGAIYGREAIAKVFEEMFKEPSDFSVSLCNSLFAKKWRNWS